MRSRSSRAAPATGRAEKTSLTRVYKTTRDGKRLTLEQECLQSGTLPSIAYGFKRCSLKHKIGPQEKFCNHY